MKSTLRRVVENFTFMKFVNESLIVQIYNSNKADFFNLNFH